MSLHSILWLIIKIIGIVLLIVLGILIATVLIVLFVPFRYRADATVSGDVKSLKANATISWLFRLIYGYVIYEDSHVEWQFRIFWKKLNLQKQKKLKTDSAQEELTNCEETEADTDTKEMRQEDILQEETTVDSAQKNSRSKKKPLFEKIKYTFRTICDKIKMLIRQKEQLQEFLSNEIHKSSWAKLIQQIVRLLRYIRPRKLKLNLHFGFEDPSLTGKTLALLSMLYPLYSKGIKIEPDFEKKILEGNAHTSGNIYNVHLLLVLCSLLFDENIKTTYNALENWER